MNSASNYDAHHYPFLTNIFGQMSDAQVTQILADTHIFPIEAGDYIFRQGDTQNALFIVLSGRLRVLHQTDSNIKILGDVSAGEPVGELALFTKEPRTASVVALRKSTILQLTEADYLNLVQKFPALAHNLTNFVIQRLRRNAFQQRMGAAPKNIAIVRLQPDLDLSPWTDDIQKELNAMNVAINVFYPEDLSADNPHALFEDMDNHEGLNFLVCDDQHPEWANQCLTYCDLVLVVTDFKVPSVVCPIEDHLKLYTANILSKKIYLLLLHPENAPLPMNTRRWFEGRTIDLHLHIRKNNALDTRRFSRIITHQAVGLVLGGGGAKGYAHIGAVKAMIEAGIEFDFVGGTSAGALYGIGLTLTDFDMAKMADLSKRGADNKPTSNDYNFPFLSLMTGRKMRKILLETFGDTHLEDIWINSYCVSTDYSTASLKVHNTGLARQKIEASIAIPGVFPPVIIDRHLHVDGGVVDNLPIEAMYENPVHHVIAIALSTQSAHFVDIKTVPSAWEIFINKFTKKHRYRLPKMPALLINSLTLNSVQKQATTKTQVSMYLEMDLRAFGFLDWSKWEELIDKGYAQTQAFLKNRPTREQFWK